MTASRLVRLVSAGFVIALATAGCIGSTSPSTSSGRSDDIGLTPLKTDLAITYYALQCPPGARCAGRVQSTGDLTFVRAIRKLRCNQDGGNYTDPAAACKALRHIVAKLATKNWTCGCALPAHPDDQAVGIYQGKRRTIPLDGCDLCNLDGIGADLDLLMPGRQ